MKKKILKQIIFYFGFLISATLLLTLVAMIPTKAIQPNVEKSLTIFSKELNRKIIDLPISHIKMDTYTDAMMFNVAYSIDSSKPFESALIARRNYVPGITKEVIYDSIGETISVIEDIAYNDLAAIVEGQNILSFEYARYWHGYLVLLRPLLLFLDYSGIRILLFLILGILSFFFFKTIYKKLGWEAIYHLLFPLLIVGFHFSFLTLQSATAYIIILTSSLILLKKESIKEEPCTFFFIIGCITNFFDFLSTPLLTLGIPLILIFLLRKKENLSSLQCFTIFFRCSLLWTIGYATTFLGKWIIVDLFYHRNLILSSIGQSLYRSVTTENAIEVILSNLTWLDRFLLLAWLITSSILCRVTKRTHLKFQPFAFYLPFLLIGILPFLWYIVIRQHSYIHCMFTYRNLLLSLTCISIIISSSCSKKE